MRTLVSLALVSVLAVPLPAQNLAEACAALGKVTVGQWAEYKLTSPEIPGGSATMRLAIIGTEQAKGKDHYWYETSMAGPMGAMVMQMLIPGYPYDDQDIARIVVKPGNQPAMELPASMLAMMPQGGGGESPARGAAENCDRATLAGTESVAVPAGTFSTMKIVPTDAEAGDLWISAAVPFGIVRFSDRRGSAMELTAHGKDAKSSITETPRKMPGG